MLRVGEYNVMLNSIQHLLRRYQTLNQVQGDVYSRFVSCCQGDVQFLSSVNCYPRTCSSWWQCIHIEPLYKRRRLGPKHNMPVNIEEIPSAAVPAIDIRVGIRLWVIPLLNFPRIAPWGAWGAWMDGGRSHTQASFTSAILVSGFGEQDGLGLPPNEPV